MKGKAYNCGMASKTVTSNHLSMLSWYWFKIFFSFIIRSFCSNCSEWSFLNYLFSSYWSLVVEYWWMIKCFRYNINQTYRVPKKVVQDIFPSSIVVSYVKHENVYCLVDTNCFWVWWDKNPFKCCWQKYVLSISMVFNSTEHPSKMSNGSKAEHIKWSQMSSLFFAYPLVVKIILIKFNYCCEIDV